MSRKKPKQKALLDVNLKKLGLHIISMTIMKPLKNIKRK